MTKEEIELLLKDLCARLLYGVKIQSWYGEIITSDLNTFPFSMEEMDEEDTWDQLSCFKPYLRPMSSMTEEEKKIYKTKQTVIFDFKNIKHYIDNYNSLDYLNSIHIDYRGLIPRGLALEAPEEMYKI